MTNKRREYLAEYAKRPEVRKMRAEASQRWRRAHPEKSRELLAESNRRRTATPELREARSARRRESYQKEKQQKKEQRDLRHQYVLNRYGGRCKCCGEDSPEFLCLDHVKNDGAAHRKSLNRTSMWDWAFRNGCPDTLQLLCYNCNCSKGKFGYCPHEREDLMSRAGIG
jgi:hypothetical protein